MNKHKIYKTFRKQLIILSMLVGLILSTSSHAYTQQLDDIEVISIPLQTLERTNYGLIAKYTTSTIYQGTLYLPSIWFVGIGEGKVIATTDASPLSLLPYPVLKVIYANGILSRVSVILPKSYLENGIPLYAGEINNELKSKFDEQLKSDFLPLESQE